MLAWSADGARVFVLALGNEWLTFEAVDGRRIAQTKKRLTVTDHVVGAEEPPATFAAKQREVTLASGRVQSIPGVQPIAAVASSFDARTIAVAMAAADEAQYPPAMTGAKRESIHACDKGDPAPVRAHPDFFFAFDVATGASVPIPALRTPRFRVVHDGLGHHVALFDRITGSLSCLPARRE